MDILHNGVKKAAEQVYADAHAELMSKPHTFDLVYNEPWDAGNPEYQMDASTVAFIATLLPALPVYAEPTVYWYSTVHGLIIGFKTIGHRLDTASLRALGSDQRIRWAECTPCTDEPTNPFKGEMSIGLMFLKEYEAL